MNSISSSANREFKAAWDARDPVRKEKKSGKKGKSERGKKNNLIQKIKQQHLCEESQA